MKNYKLKSGEVGKAAVHAYRKIENAAVGTYKKVEDAAVGAYKKVENAFVNAFLEEVGEADSEKGGTST